MKTKEWGFYRKKENIDKYITIQDKKNKGIMIGNNKNSIRRKKVKKIIYH